MAALLRHRRARIGIGYCGWYIFKWPPTPGTFSTGHGWYILSGRRGRECATRGSPIVSGSILRFIASPVPVAVFRHGRKYWGARIDDIPLDYLSWVLLDSRKPEAERFMVVDSDTLAAVTISLMVRSGKVAA